MGRALRVRCGSPHRHRTAGGPSCPTVMPRSLRPGGGAWPGVVEDGWPLRRRRSGLRSLLPRRPGGRPITASWGRWDGGPLLPAAWQPVPHVGEGGAADRQAAGGRAPGAGQDRVPAGPEPLHRAQGAHPLPLPAAGPSGPGQRPRCPPLRARRAGRAGACGHQKARQHPRWGQLADGRPARATATGPPPPAPHAAATAARCWATATCTPPSTITPAKRDASSYLCLPWPPATATGEDRAPSCVSPQSGGQVSAVSAVLCAFEFEGEHDLVDAVEQRQQSDPDDQHTTAGLTVPLPRRREVPDLTRASPRGGRHPQLYARFGAVAQDQLVRDAAARSSAQVRASIASRTASSACPTAHRA
jgi:hypothetical protein